MKKVMILVLGACSLVACATFQSQPAFDWTGQNFDDYVIKYGMPTAQVALQSGNMAYSFIKQCSYSPDIEENTIMVDPENIITGITQKSTCPSFYEARQERQQIQAVREQKIQTEHRNHNKEIEKELEYTNASLHVLQLEKSDKESSLRLAESQLSSAKAHAESKAKLQSLGKDNMIGEFYGPSIQESEIKIKQLQEELTQMKKKQEELERKKAQLETSYW